MHAYIHVFMYLYTKRKRERERDIYGGVSLYLSPSLFHSLCI